jgi:hypothetical protein
VSPTAVSRTWRVRAGDPRPGVAGRIALVIIGILMHHQRRAVGIEQRVRAGAEDLAGAALVSQKRGQIR